MKLVARLRGKPTWKWLVPLIAVVVVAALAVTYFVMRGNRSEAAPAARTTTATAATTTMEKSVTASGTLTPAVTQDAAFEASGTVTKVYVSEGDTVKKGQKLALIDTTQLTEAKLAAKVTYLSALADYQSAKADDDGTDLTDARISATKSALKIAKKAYKEAKAAMSDKVLKSTVAGLVTAVDLEVGDVVTGTSSSTSSAASGTSGSGSQGGTTSGASSQSAAASTTSGTITIVGTDDWEVSTTVSESDIRNIKTGLQVQMTSDDLTDTLYGIVSEVGKIPSTSSGAIAYPVTIAVTGSPEGIYDGVSVDIEIIYERRTDVLAIPSAAVTTSDGASTVELVGADGTTTTATTVETGETSGNMVEITSGLSEGDTVQYQPFSGTGNSSQSGSGDSGEMSGFPAGGDFTPPSGGGGQGGPPSGFGGGQGGN
ncbi:efflux RND transporter periplasmic adaptor subunit [Rarobacter incanus]|uniref:Macrolide-specific efflux system membrane fusion protein n=1 Tax=Rarobacter incanus TaxID=153494 RepID=A0A542SP58_9MICO|nr:biotin/lipoyl-binding protein [Rarobacter incanus]TQK76399.1 macrolide-specific efflux system membrane fusion protein [Rarobacter incanus]